MDLVDKKVVVIGLGKRTGVAAAKFLVDKGAKVVVSDVKSKEELQAELEELDNYEIDFDLGGHTERVIEDTDLIVISPGVPDQIPILKRVRELGIRIISEIELAYHFCKAPIIAITGTNGKTTTTTLTGEIFKEACSEVVVGGNIGRPLIQDVPNISSEGFVISEISSFQLENVENFRPKISLILNLTPDHLDRHGTFANYIAAKKRIFSNQKQSDYTVLNYDDQLTREFGNETKGEVVYFSQKEDIKDGGLYVEDGKIISTLTGNKEFIIEVDKIGIKGPHNLENALGATAIAILSGIDLEVIKQVLQEFDGVEHRIEEVAVVGGVKYINDSKGTNPVAAIKALETFDAPLILIAGGMDKNADFAEFANKIVNNVKELILLGETADQIEADVHSLDFTNVKKVDSIEEAVQVADTLGKEGDYVLLSPACASWDMFSSYKERGRKFKQAVYDLRGQ